MLILENITKHYRISGKKKVILDDLNFEIKKGEIISITGKSGCGKSTLLNIISGLAVPDKGKVYFNNRRIYYFLDVHTGWLRNNKIGFIFQTFRLLYDESVITNVLLPAKIKGWVDKKTYNRAEEILNELEILEYKNMKTGLLSGGQKQRVAIARALINDPDIILADEPTANLDKITSIEICKILANISKNNKSVIVVTHQDYMFEHSNKVFELINGKLKEVNDYHEQEKI